MLDWIKGRYPKYLVGFEYKHYPSDVVGVALKDPKNPIEVVDTFSDDVYDAMQEAGRRFNWARMKRVVVYEFVEEHSDEYYARFDERMDSEDGFNWRVSWGASSVWYGMEEKRPVSKEEAGA